MIYECDKNMFVNINESFFVYVGINSRYLFLIVKKEGIISKKNYLDLYFIYMYIMS